ncbi:type XI myosin MyoF [Corchorus olitorius]|uniref:Type XI myosin MyoF n=1 Tax=Corchorus olitorius TaxID=93759 RepID=A0A1R3K6B2_9ROSI|nr:type XI myosin MyoF [Corchorus olitorius]
MEADLDFGCQACKQHQEESKITVSFDRINAFMYYNVDEGSEIAQGNIAVQDIT